MKTGPPIRVSGPPRKLTEAELLEYNDNHEPAGSSAGGQFASGDGGAASGSTGDTAKVASPEQWHEKNKGNWESSLSKDQKTALKTYRETGYARMNNFLRGGGNINAQGQQAILTRNLRAGMKPLDKDVLVFRGINGDVPEFGKVGNVVSDAGFVSTSIDEGVARSFSRSDTKTIARIKMRKGAHVGYANEMDEREVIVHNGAKFRVTGIKTVRGIKYVDMEYV